MKVHDPLPEKNAMIPRIVFGVVGSVFALIGVSIIVAMWTAPYNDFFSPPLFFRVFASLIALCFVAIGGGTAIAAISGEMKTRPDATITREVPSVGYVCPQCGSALGKNADVSPMGDVKCSFCQRWFNIHRPTAT